MPGTGNVNSSENVRDRENSEIRNLFTQFINNSIEKTNDKNLTINDVLSMMVVDFDEKLGKYYEGDIEALAHILKATDTEFKSLIKAPRENGIEDEKKWRTVIGRFPEAVLEFNQDLVKNKNDMDENKEKDEKNDPGILEQVRNWNIFKGKMKLWIGLGVAVTVALIFLAPQVAAPILAVGIGIAAIAGTVKFLSNRKKRKRQEVDRRVNKNGDRVNRERGKTEYEKQKGKNKDTNMEISPEHAKRRDTETSREQGRSRDAEANREQDRSRDTETSREQDRGRDSEVEVSRGQGKSRDTEVSREQVNARDTETEENKGIDEQKQKNSDKMLFDDQTFLQKEVLSKTIEMLNLGNKIYSEVSQYVKLDSASPEIIEMLKQEKDISKVYEKLKSPEDKDKLIQFVGEIVNVNIKQDMEYYTKKFESARALFVKNSDASHETQKVAARIKYADNPMIAFNKLSNRQRLVFLEVVLKARENDKVRSGELINKFSQGSKSNDMNRTMR